MAPDQVDLSALQTEGQNETTQQIDVVSTLDMCRLINQEDQKVALAVEQCLPAIAAVIDAVLPRLRKGGRVVYVGAGTSGRLGILDASEIPPTFSAPYGQFVGLIAGGDHAIRYAVEGAEDSTSQGAKDLSTALSPPFTAQDSLIGLAASGRTPYVLGAMRFARQLGAVTAGICCVTPSAMRETGALLVECPVGPEVVTGSTRMKSGTAQKMILNMISTGLMIRSGKTYGNIMVDVKRSNIKLIHRARRIFRMVFASLNHPPEVLDMADDQALDELIDRCNGSVKTAIVAAQWNVTLEEAQHRLESVNGVLKPALIGP